MKHRFLISCVILTILVTLFSTSPTLAQNEEPVTITCNQSPCQILSDKQITDLWNTPVFPINDVFLVNSNGTTFSLYTQALNPNFNSESNPGYLAPSIIIFPYDKDIEIPQMGISWSKKTFKVTYPEKVVSEQWVDIPGNQTDTIPINWMTEKHKPRVCSSNLVTKDNIFLVWFFIPQIDNNITIKLSIDTFAWYLLVKTNTLPPYSSPIYTPIPTDWKPGKILEFVRIYRYPTNQPIGNTGWNSITYTRTAYEFIGPDNNNIVIPESQIFPFIPGPEEGSYIKLDPIPGTRLKIYDTQEGVFFLTDQINPQ